MWRIDRQTQAGILCSLLHAILNSTLHVEVKLGNPGLEGVDLTIVVAALASRALGNLNGLLQNTTALFVFSRPLPGAPKSSFKFSISVWNVSIVRWSSSARMISDLHGLGMLLMVWKNVHHACALSLLYSSNTDMRPSWTVLPPSRRSP